jgi:hypothetical protein
MTGWGVIGLGVLITGLGVVGGLSLCGADFGLVGARSLFASLVIPVPAIIIGLGFLVTADLIVLFINIEENTMSSTQQIADLSRQLPVGSPKHGGSAT